MLGSGWTLIILKIPSASCSLLRLCHQRRFVPAVAGSRVSTVVAIHTSIKAVLLNPIVMAALALFIAVALVIGALPFFVGLAVVMAI